MKRMCLLTVCIIFSAAGVQAQDLSYFGNLKVESAWHHAESAVADPSVSWFGLSDWQTAAITAEADLKLNWDTVLFRVHQDLAFDQEAAFTYRLFEGYASFTPAPPFTVTVGKRHVSWGTGYFFLPADKLNPLSLDPSSARRDEGFPGVAVTLSPTSDFTMIAAVSFDQSLKHPADEFFRYFRYGLVLSLLAGPLNLKADLVYQADHVCRPGGGLTLDLGGFIFFGEAAVELHNRTLYPSTVAVWTEHDLWTPWLSVEAGVRRGFSVNDATLFAVAEYLYAADGFTPGEEDLFFQAVSMGGAPTPGHLGRHYLLFSLAFSWERAFSTEHAALWNAQDGSLFFTHRLTLLAVENLDLYVDVMWTVGDNRTEFGAAGERLRAGAGALVYF